MLSTGRFGVGCFRSVWLLTVVGLVVCDAASSTDSKGGNGINRYIEPVWACDYFDPHFKGEVRFPARETIRELVSNYPMHDVMVTRNQGVIIVMRTRHVYDSDGRKRSVYKCSTDFVEDEAHVYLMPNIGTLSILLATLITRHCRLAGIALPW